MRSLARSRSRGSVVASMALAAVTAACRREPTGEAPTSSGAAREAAPDGCGGVLRDCDGRSDNGCEVRLGTPAHCGGCERRCADGEQCLGTSCQPDGDLAMSGEHTCVLDRAGRVRCWGANRSGEIGDGTRLMRERPVVVAGVDDAVQLVVRDRQTCVRRRAGAVSCWGNRFGTGNPGTADLVPTELEALRGATDLALAEDVLCGLLPGGKIVCLPSSKLDKARADIGPPPGEPVEDAVDLAATPRQLCACRRGGTVICWDMRAREGAAPEERKTRVTGVHDALSLTSGGDTICAIRADGRATCWGGGIVTAPGGLRDAMVGGAHDFSSVGPVSDLAFVGWPHDEDCAIRISGETLCWAPPHIDPKSPPPLLEVRTKPVDVPPAYRIEATTFHVSHCVLTKTGDVYCWGDPSFGRLGVGRAPEQPSPRPIEGVRDVREVVASDHRACARTASGSLVCWGGGKTPHAVKAAGVDQLLSGRCASVRGELVCFEEMFDTLLPASGLRDVVQIVPAASGSHLLSYFARHRNGTISRVDWARSNTSHPEWSRRFVGPVRGLSSVKELIEAGDSTCARDDATTLRCWGSYGDPAPDAEGRIELQMKQITLPAGFEQVRVIRVLDTGYYEACGVRKGRVACWDDKRELRWSELRDVRSFGVSPGGMRCALVEGGALSCWGDGYHTMTGHGTVAGVREPQPVPGLVDVVGWTFPQKSWSGKDAVYVWQRDGRLLAWGHNATGSDDATRGQLGWVAPSRIEAPTKVVERGN